MATQVQIRRGTTAEHGTFTGAVGELTVDTDKDVVVVHDGATVGGRPMLRENGSQNLVTTGTATAASFIPTSSTAPTNGVYLPAANSVAISTGGSGRLFVDSSGNVALGTNSPVSFNSQTSLTIRGTSVGRLDLQGAAGAGGGSITGTATAFGFEANFGIPLSFTTGATQPITFTTNSSERLRITSTGTVNIVGAGSAGSTQAVSFNGSAPVNSLVVDSSGRLGVGTSSPSVRCQIDDVANSAPVTLLRVNNTGTTSGGAGLASRITFTGGATNLGFIQGSNYASGKGGIQLSGDGTNVHVTLDGATGALGIGTSDLTYGGQLTVRGASTVVASFMNSNFVAATSGTQLNVIVGAATGNTNFQLQVNSGGGLAFNDLILQPNGGKVGIGDTGPDSTLTIKAAASTTPLRVSGPSSEFARIDSSGRLLVGTSSNIDANSKLQIESDANDKIVLKATSAVANNGSQINWYVGSALKAAIYGGNDSSSKSSLVFSTCPDGSATPQEQMRITNDGQTYFGITGNTGLGTTNRGFLIRNELAGKTYVQLASTGTTTDTVFYFYNGNGLVGSISMNGSATAYNTSSDYRLKENVAPVPDGIARLQQLKPIRFNFIADPATTVDGFIAHEVQAVVPEAITGEKDAVDDDGNPIYQGIDQSKLVPLLTAALQEAIGEIESLKARVAALEAA